MRYGMLIRVASDVGNRTVWTDFNYRMSQAGNDPKTGLTLAFAAMATSFTKRAFKADMMSMNQDRFQQSVALASAFHAHGFFAFAQLVKSFGA